MTSPFDQSALIAMAESLVLAARTTARQLRLTSTGHAQRGVSAPPSPSPSNLATLEPADDLEFRYATNAPTVRIEELTVAGQ